MVKIGELKETMNALYLTGLDDKTRRGLPAGAWRLGEQAIV
jgi:hypothetical protein